MHKFAMEMMECVKSEVKSKGLNSLSDDELARLKTWSEIADHIAAFDYHYHITEAMEKPENEYGKNYDENGRFYTHHNPEMMRDMDTDMGKMYYPEYHMRDMREMDNHTNGSSMQSRYDRAKKGYEESKSLNPSGDHISMMETFLDILDDDVKELKPKMTANEKSIARQKFTNMANNMM